MSARRATNGSAYTSRPFRVRLAEHHVIHRRGGYRDPESQAFTESWFSKLKLRCVWRGEFDALEQARQVIGAYIDSYHDRPHSGLNYRTPREVAATWQDHQARRGSERRRCPSSPLRSHGARVAVAPPRPSALAVRALRGGAGSVSSSTLWSWAAGRRGRQLGRLAPLDSVENVVGRRIGLGEHTLQVRSPDDPLPYPGARPSAAPCSPPGRPLPG